MIDVIVQQLLSSSYVNCGVRMCWPPDSELGLSSSAHFLVERVRHDFTIPIYRIY